ncbi:unnamed protein product, partial [Mesorhabditis belari]|uniref:Uncharacterized protein n=1 Tax=Mesorhabditis belari TaxID=2138241 RepID=A0AAF3F3W3_9BILA
MCNMHPALIVIPYVLELIVLCVWLTVIVIVHFTKVYRDAYDTVTIHHKVHNTNVEKQKKDFEIGRQTNFLKGGTVEADPKEVPVDELPELSPAGTSLRYASTMKVPSITQSIQQSLRAPSVYKLIEADDPGA